MNYLRFLLTSAVLYSFALGALQKPGALGFFLGGVVGLLVLEAVEAVRVRADFSQRLGSAEKQLSSQAGQLSEHIGTLNAVVKTGAELERQVKNLSSSVALKATGIGNLIR